MKKEKPTNGTSENGHSAPDPADVMSRWEKLMEATAEREANGEIDPAATRSMTTEVPEAVIRGYAKSAVICGDPQLSRMSSVTAESVNWLWPGRFPIGML